METMQYKGKTYYRSKEGNWYGPNGMRCVQLDQELDALWFENNKEAIQSKILAAKISKQDIEQKRQEAKQLLLEQRHKERLEALGVLYLGVIKADKKYHRSTHCYACKSHLDSSINFECLSCGWIICSCGACGCGRRA